jgi:hypothetical protein
MKSSGRLALSLAALCGVWLGCTGQVLTEERPSEPGCEERGDCPPGSPDAGIPGPIDAAEPEDPDAREPDDEPDARVPSPPDAARPPDPDELEWRQARLTNFTSYPEPGSDECEDFNGCKWAGYFAFVDGRQSETWVMNHNIVAVHSRDGDEYGLKTLRLRKDGDEIDVTVYDVCSDSDCSGCCTRNAAETGFLVDIESYTRDRFGHGDGNVEWACLDCD